MLPWILYLVDRWSGPRSRACELLGVRRRLLAQDRAGSASRTEVLLALRLRELREEMVARLGEVEACAHCTQPTSTDWPGGSCCSGATDDLFGDHELAALRLAGTKPRHLRPPRGAHLGCAFRGPTGCSLEVAHRPSVCAGFACRELLVELRRRGDEPAIGRLQDELQNAFQRFLAERKARIRASVFEDFRRALETDDGGPP